MRIEGPKADLIVSGIINLIQSATATLQEVGSAARAYAKRTEWEYEMIHRKSPVTDEEIAKDDAIMKMEHDAREREARVRLLEIQAREELAKAQKAEAIVRLKTASVRQNQQRQTQAQQARPKLPPFNEVMKGETVKKEQQEGQLTHNMGDKLKSTQPS